MTITEFSNQFDVLYNNITSNQAPGLNEYEKSVFLTKAQNEIVKNYFTANSKGNNIGQGFDDSAKRQADFSSLMMTSICTSGSTDSSTTIKTYSYTPSIGNTIILNDPTFTQSGSSVELSEGSYPVMRGNIYGSLGDAPIVVSGIPSGVSNTGTLVVEEIYAGTRLDTRSSLYSFPSDVFILINERIIGVNGGVTSLYQVIPLRFDEYTRLMSKPYKRPLKNQAWRLINNGKSAKAVEIITPPDVTISSYTVRYIRKPKPIIVGNLDGLTIDNYYIEGTTGPTGALTTDGECEIDSMLHEDILQRAVELAKVAWTATGNDNAQMVLQAGQRSE